ncbi:MAG: cytochrome c biogenesis protein ResB [Bdellovibrio sp.]
MNTKTALKKKFSLAMRGSLLSGSTRIRWIRALASLKIAVFVILALGVLTAVGTFVEAKYDATAASKLVYRTSWMFFVMGLLALNLTAVMVDRWPWKKRHIPFLLAHLGILVLLAGSLVTYFWGVDGSMRVAIGESNRWVSVPETELTLWSSFDGQSFSRVAQTKVDFFLKPPQRSPVEFPGFGDKGLKVLAYHPYVVPSRKIVASEDPQHGAGLRFLLQNQRVNQSEWILEKRPGEAAQVDLGPALVHLGPAPKKPTGKNEIYVQALSSTRFRYQIFVREGGLLKTGILGLAEALPTPWMGLVFKVLFYHPRAEETWDFQIQSRPGPLTNSAIQLEFGSRVHWLQLNDVLKLFERNLVYIVSFANRKLDLGFPIYLKEFNVGRYQGTNKAMTYQSLVNLAEMGEQVISMNEPLKHRRFTVYQASFQENEQGHPIASIFSVNYDPGRWIKYLGSLILSLGVIWLFYNRRRARY